MLFLYAYLIGCLLFGVFAAIVFLQEAQIKFKEKVFIILYNGITWPFTIIYFFILVPLIIKYLK